MKCVDQRTGQVGYYFLTKKTMRSNTGVGINFHLILKCFISYNYSIVFTSS